MYSTAILSNTATIREEKSTEIDSVFQLKLYRETHRITRHYSAAGEQEIAKQTLTTSKYSSEFTYSNFPYHLEVNRDKLACFNTLLSVLSSLMAFISNIIIYYPKKSNQNNIFLRTKIPF